MILINALVGEIVFTRKVALDGELSTQESFSINGNVINGGAKTYPNYTGTYEVTPTSEVQVLPTENRTLTRDIVINPIPSNYGLITWNGSVLTVS